MIEEQSRWCPKRLLEDTGCNIKWNNEYFASRFGIFEPQRSHIPEPKSSVHVGTGYDVTRYDVTGHDVTLDQRRACCPVDDVISLGQPVALLQLRPVRHGARPQLERSGGGSGCGRRGGHVIGRWPQGIVVECAYVHLSAHVAAQLAGAAHRRHHLLQSVLIYNIHS